MTDILLISAVVLLTLLVVDTNADLRHCDTNILPSHSDIVQVGPKVDPGDKLKVFLWRSNCKLRESTKGFRHGLKEKSMKWNEDMREGFKKVKKEAKHVNDKLDLLENTMRECAKKLKEEAKDIYENFDLKDIKKEWNTDVRVGFRMFMQRGKEFRAKEQSGRTCMKVLRNLRK